VTDWKEGYEVARKKVDPLAVAIRGPRSIISAIHPTVTVSMGYDREHFEGIAPVKLAYPEEIAALVEKTVKVVPLQVRVEVELKPKIETLSAAAVRITFRIPPPELPIKIYVDELSGGTIPVEFYGPRDRIGRLADRLKEPGFALAVRVPSFDIEPGETREFTFTEESLEIYGFPDIQLRPHESRRTLKRPWTYRLVAVKEAEK
jgi:hypothetical protein